MDEQIEQNYQEKEEKPKKRRIWFWFFVVILILAAAAGTIFYKAGFTFSQMNIDNGRGGVLPISEDAPKIEKDPDRTNILLLGLRGPEDPNGGLLTDTMMILSIKLSTGQVGMISIPRDLYVKMPAEAGKNNNQPLKEKINFAYALGEEKMQGGGLVYSKVAIQAVTGLYIDHVVSVDFSAFKDIVDILGGVDITLDKPFVETTQFAKEILLDLPAGKNHLDGTTALFYVRSRYSTNDFDRARRQQQLMIAMKDKALSLGILLNPVKIFGLLDTMGKNVRTDMNLGEMENLVSLSKNLDFKNIKHKVFDTTPEGLLYATTSERGAYILLPQGDNFEKIQAACKNIFQ